MIYVYQKNEDPETFGTHRVGTINATYSQLINLLGQPTFPEQSGDGKVQVEWVVEYKGEIFTIYDWKTYDRYYTENTLGTFNVGGKSYAGDFIEFLETQL